MHLDLSDDETAALTKELDDITRNDRYPFSERIRTLTRSRHMPSQQLATLSAANDQDFKPFWLRHELPPCTTLKGAR